MTHNHTKPLFVFDLANNHQGSLEHGLRIIREVAEVCKNFDFDFGFKFQYRNLDSFIHPEFKDRNDLKYIKRFLETRLQEDDFIALKKEAENCGFISVCTPFDERSVESAQAHGFKIIKIASASFTDWPLLERIVRTDKPIIASLAGASIDDIDKMVSFFDHRQKDYTLMHCVGLYPVQDDHLQLNQLDVLRNRYPGVKIGYSTHEHPDNRDAVKIAIAKGARVFEKHAGIETKEFRLNAYSANPQQINKWLTSAKEAFKMCGEIGRRNQFPESELRELRDLRRGVFAGRDIKSGEKITQDEVYFAIPLVDGQVSANDMSKYTQFFADSEIKKDKPVLFNSVHKKELREKIYNIMMNVKKLLKKSNCIVPNMLDFEVSYQYGIDNFEKYGACIINFVNRDYCKKIIVLLPGQEHPEQLHNLKEETFNVLYGDMTLALNGNAKKYKAGDWILVEKGVAHKFSTEHGAVIEEISSSYLPEDSHYLDPEITKNKDRKTYLTYWVD